MRRAFITGVTGQDGIYLTELLLRKGYQVFGLVRGQNNPKLQLLRRVIPGLQILTGDLTDLSSLLRALRVAQPDEVYNLGAISFVGYSWENAHLTTDVTGKGVLNMLEATRLHCGDDLSRVRFYQASSSEMFGKAREVPQNETTLLWPRSPYGVAKVFGHYMTINYRESYGMHASSGILFNHESPRRGPEFVTRKITQGVARISLGLQESIALGNLDPQRDWGFAGDYVEAMWSMLQQDTADDYVIATGETHSIREFLDIAFSRVGIDDWSGYVTHDPQLLRPAEVDLLVGNSAKADDGGGGPRRARGYRRSCPMTAVLVTGATGQDGSYLVERLVNSGDQVHVLIRESEPLGYLAPLVAAGLAHLHTGDLAAPGKIADLLRDVGPDEIYHLAGISSVAQSWMMPVEVAQLTAVAVAHLLEAAWQVSEDRGAAVRFLQPSSAEIFGATEVCPQDEFTPVRPSSPYGAAKAFAHHLVGVYRARGLHAVSVILYNHESPRRPDTFVTRKITKAVAEISTGRSEPLALGDLDLRRDWGWAPDYVDAMVLGARHNCPADYVIATGESHTIREFAEAAFAHVGIDKWERYIYSDPAFRRPSESFELRGDASRARKALGWGPTKGFRDVVAAMVDAEPALRAG
jgi:GDPmannose 4,6-dehydratase